MRPKIMVQNMQKCEDLITTIIFYLFVYVFLIKSLGSDNLRSFKAEKEFYLGPKLALPSTGTFCKFFCAIENMSPPTAGTPPLAALVCRNCTFLPCFARYVPAISPLCPAPTTSASYFLVFSWLWSLSKCFADFRVRKKSVNLNSVGYWFHR